MSIQVQKTPESSIADEAVIDRILNGEHRAYEIIMRKYNAMLYRVGMSMINNDAEVEDIMQVTYIKAYEHLHKFEKRAGFSTWLTRILINESLYRLKKNKRTTSMELNDETPQQDKANTGAYSPVHALLNKELTNVLEDALVQLPEKYRLVFVLREMENKSIDETVDILNITEANVKVRLNRAKTMLRDTLGGYYKNEGVYHFHLTRCDRMVNNVFHKLGIATG